MSESGDIIRVAKEDSSVKVPAALSSGVKVSTFGWGLVSLCREFV